MGRKLAVLGDYRNPLVPRGHVAANRDEVAKTHEALRKEFSRLWLAECKDGTGFRSQMKRFDNTIIPCRERAKELRGR